VTPQKELKNSNVYKISSQKKNFLTNKTLLVILLRTFEIVIEKVGVIIPKKSQEKRENILIIVINRLWKS